MTRITPKAGRGGRIAKKENFSVNEPGREPFYVHAYHSGPPEASFDLQVIIFTHEAAVNGRIMLTFEGKRGEGPEETHKCLFA